MIDYKKYPIPRVRHHASPQLYLKAEQQIPNVPNVEWYPEPVQEPQWEEWFGRNVEARVLDIGCGRGGFLINHALANPDVPILGLEVRQQLVSWINGVIDGEGLRNVRALWQSVANGLGFIRENSIEYATYFFPDPWPKRRHHKRRAFSEPFLDELCRVLMPGGRLYLATDRPDVDEYQRETITSQGAMRIVDVGIDELSPWPFNFKTDHQQFCERKGIPYTRYFAQL